MDYEILPYIGAGALRFGMTQGNVGAILGPPELTLSDSDTGLVTDYWNDNGLQLAFDLATGQLQLISFYSNIANVRVGPIAIDWDNSDLVYQDLLQNDPSAMQTVGITVFFGHGISVAGFLGRDNSDKSLTVFAKGQWSPDDPTLKKI